MSALPIPQLRNDPAEDASPTAPRSVRADLAATTPAEAVHPTPPDLPGDEAPVQDRGLEDRYRRQKSLGTGGMGEVALCLDERVGREVAVKVLRPEVATSRPARLRFLREARLQGQLEHPAIVPVHDIGVSPGGRDYFTMKRVRGFTLQEILIRIRQGDERWTRRFPTRRLLTAFVQVCRAIEFAHSRAVVHRDLKPGNLMLGDFGEVYVLDWGLAKVLDAPASQPEPPADGATGAATDSGPLRFPEEPAVTRDGILMGTIGYMAPELLRGAPVDFDARADVYALGAILFEILALEPLHGEGEDERIIESTLRGPDVAARLADSGREAPPELEAICLRATALDPAQRTPSARALHEELEAYLEGDRDLERRRAASQGHVALAEQAWAAVERGADPDDAARTRASREATRALALDPDNRRAVQMLVRTLTTTSPSAHPDVRAELDATLIESVRQASRAGRLGYLAWFAGLPLILSMGVRWWWPLITSTLLMLVSLAINVHSSRRRTFSSRLEVLALGVTALAQVPTAFLLGPLVLLPGVACILAVAFALKAHRRLQMLAIAVPVLMLALPIALELAGLLPPSYDFRDGALVLLPRGVHLPPTQTMILLLLSSFLSAVVCGLIAARVRNVLTSAERRVQLQAWQLRQLLPDEAKRAVSHRPPPPRSGFCPH